MMYILFVITYIRGAQSTQFAIQFASNEIPILYNTAFIGPICNELNIVHYIYIYTQVIQRFLQWAKRRELIYHKGHVS